MKPTAELKHSESWIFDLDNTLYPASTGLMAEVSSRMTAFVADLLRLEHDAALIEQKRMFREHGTTLRGLMNDHAVDPTKFMDYVHSVNYTLVDESPRLARALNALPGRKIIFTNASVTHAKKVLERLGVLGAFSGIFDVAAADYIPKPHPRPYDVLAKQHAINPKRTVMVEDLARNLAPAAAMGMTTLWVRADDSIEAHWAAPSEDDDYVHHRTDDLVGWLEEIAAFSS
ncbi:MAG: pyrimidine 5'-nucleotidase [Rhodospirillaceae bacterium]|nr:pyrimidine 5'-nucleotidase [Rhodospirillaceae bacterium]|tara:strand:- start:3661 stop:4350 length:690 start_codon:yes stop_codon:yes gene_type:complete